MSDPYPVTIRKSRYGGTYEGGRWFAVNADDSPDGAEAGDNACERFWRSPAAKEIGRGETPNDAYADLIRRLADLASDPVTP